MSAGHCGYCITINGWQEHDVHLSDKHFSMAGTAIERMTDCCMHDYYSMWTGEQHDCERELLREICSSSDEISEINLQLLKL